MAGTVYELIVVDPSLKARLESQVEAIHASINVCSSNVEEIEEKLDECTSSKQVIAQEIQKFGEERNNIKHLINEYKGFEAAIGMLHREIDH
jgi:chromosome segregation ATPase